MQTNSTILKNAKRLLVFSSLLFVSNVMSAAEPAGKSRAMWASINTNKDASLGDYTKYNNKMLISWRMLPGDDENTSFLIYARVANDVNASLTRLFAKPISKATCCQVTAPTAARTYYLLPGDFMETSPIIASDDATKKLIREAAVDSFTIGEHIFKNKLPYITIPLQDTKDVDPGEKIVYRANDCSVGDLDGDGEMEIVVKRLLGHTDKVQNDKGEWVENIDEGTGAGDSDPKCRHTVVFDAYKLDGTLLWRVKSGPNIILGNSVNFGIADLDGDGCAEVVTKTGEGTVFGDGTEIGDTDGDGRTDYRSIWPAGHYVGDGAKGYGGPEFFSVIDGKTGKELARADFINRGKDGQTPAQMASDWYDNDWAWDPRSSKYQWKLANSFRLGIASFDGKKNQIFLGRGVYGRTVVEAWDYSDGKLTRMWHFDTGRTDRDKNSKVGADLNKDGKPNIKYASQGNHSFSVADLDGDGKDEVMYGSCAFDDDGTGLWSSELGHGDAQHVGKFLPERDGLQVFHCLENGKTMVALHDAKDGSIIWSKVASTDNDMGRCLVDDINPKSKGCEFWWYGTNQYSQDGNEIADSKPASCNMSIWFDGSLSRQLINGNIIESPANGRTFTMYRYDMGFNNSTKSNPGWYGDILGDWREEVIVPSGDHLTDLKVFSTWYPSDHKFPWLMTDHTYYMSAVNQNVGYNQPTHTGYYLGSDLKNDREAWEAAGYVTTSIRGVEATASANKTDGGIYNLQGQRLSKKPQHGFYIINGKKYYAK